MRRPAVEAGAAYLGVVFAGGPRGVTWGAGQEVVAAAAEVPVLGVFADQSLDEILGIADACGLARSPAARALFAARRGAAEESRAGGLAGHADRG